MRAATYTEHDIHQVAALIKKRKVKTSDKVNENEEKERFGLRSLDLGLCVECRSVFCREASLQSAPLQKSPLRFFAPFIDLSLSVNLAFKISEEMESETLFFEGKKESFYSHWFSVGHSCVEQNLSFYLTFLASVKCARFRRCSPQRQKTKVK
jgi:hypothetical protein